MNLTKEQRQAMVEYCNLYPEVRWDRYCLYPKALTVFGWIDRDDGKSDYMQLFFEGGQCSHYMTSSARYSKEFGERLANHIGFKINHKDCKRVEYLRLPIRSVKKLKQSPGGK